MPRLLESLDRFQIGREIGRGSMAIVHEAHDPVTGHDVALKTILLPNGLESDRCDEFQSRFLENMRTAARLSHPGLVRIYGFSPSNCETPPAVAMELIGGETLHEGIRTKGPLAPEQALAVVETLADALRVAHRHGLVHGDLNSNNVMVRDEDGIAKITDLGIASVNLTDLTDPDCPHGSPAYTAPECLDGKPPDARSDLFSLAVIFYEALTGRLPFEGDDYPSICHSILHDAPTPISDALDPFFARALARDPDERFPDAAAFLKSLQQLDVVLGALEQTIDSYVEDLPKRPESAIEPRRTPSPVSPAGGAAPVLDDPAGHAASGSGRSFRGLIVAILVLLALAIGYAVFGGVGGGGPSGEPARSERLSTGGPVAGGSAMPILTVAPIASGRDAAMVETLIANAPAATPTPGPSPASRADVPRPAGPTPFAPAVPSVAAAPAAIPRQSWIADGPGYLTAALPQPTAEIELTVESRLRSGSLTLLLDGQEVFTTELSAPGGWIRDHERLVESLAVAPGRHELTARMFHASKNRTFEDTVEIVLEADRTTPVRVVAGRSLGSRVTIRLDRAPGT